MPQHKLRIWACSNDNGVVFGVADVLASGGGVAFVIDLDHGEVGHEAVRGGAVPVLLSGLEEDAVSGGE